MFRIPTGRRSWRLMVALTAAAVVAVPTLLTAMAAPASAAPSTPVAGTLASPNPDDAVPHALNGVVYSFAEIGSTVYVGGSFTTVRTATSTARLTRNYLFAYNRVTGVLNSDFMPVLDGAVHALTVSPDGMLLVGGAFRNVNGLARNNLVKLDPATGATVGSFEGRGDGGLVRKLIVRGDHLYVAGAFHFINSTRHSLLARLDVATGAIDATFKIDASGARTTSSAELVWGMDVTADGSTLLAVGNFNSVNGLARNQVVMVDTAGTPTVTNWATQRFVLPCASGSFPFYARDVDFSDDGTYFAIAADGGRQSGAYCDTITRWESAARGDVLDATWVNETGHDSVTSIEAADNVVYAAGHFRWVNNANGDDSAGPGAVNRYGYAALDPINGLPVSWNPTRSGAPAGTKTWGPIVFELWRGKSGIWAGFDADGMGSEYHGRMGLFPLAGARTIPALNAPMATAGFLYLGGTAGRLTKVPFDGTTLGTPTISNQPNIVAPRSSFSVDNRLYYTRSDTAAGARGQLQVSTFTNGVASASRLTSTVNGWFDAASKTGAFYLDGRMYFTVNGDARLYYRYFEPDGSIVGCTVFTVPSAGVGWSSVRGLAYVGGKIVYGATDGALRAVPFTTDGSVNGAAAVRLASPTATARWSQSTLFFATS